MFQLRNSFRRKKKVTRALSENSTGKKMLALILQRAEAMTTATQRERQKSNRLRLAKQQLCTCITPFCTFLCRSCTAAISAHYSVAREGFLPSCNIVATLGMSLRRWQRELRKSNRFNKQNNKSSRASHFFVCLFAVAARLRR